MEVYCDFETGETIIHHDSEDVIEAEHCEEVGCFQRQLQYSIPKEQILALTQISDQCVQDISFGCFIAPLASDLGDLFGWWTDRNGIKLDTMRLFKK